MAEGGKRAYRKWPPEHHSPETLAPRRRNESDKRKKNGTSLSFSYVLRLFAFYVCVLRLRFSFCVRGSPCGCGCLTRVGFSKRCLNEKWSGRFLYCLFPFFPRHRPDRDLGRPVGACRSECAPRTLSSPFLFPTLSRSLLLPLPCLCVRLLEFPRKSNELGK